MPGSNPSRDPRYPYPRFYFVPPDKYWDYNSIMTKPPPSTSCPIHYLPVILLTYLLIYLLTYLLT